MIRRLKLIFLIGILIGAFGCQKNLEDLPNYKRPSWLAGKVYTQISSNDSLKIFAACVKKVGYDTILNTSGCYTVFAPSDNAFAEFFKNHANYNGSVDNIPYDTLVRIVRSHIINDPWSLEQLHQLDVDGWIDTLGLTNNRPFGYKRESLLRDPNIKIGIAQYPKDTKRIVDTTQAVYTNIRYTDGNKFASIFYKQYFDANKLIASDYEFYFNRPFQSQYTYFMGSKIIRANIFAENGYIHIVDKVNNPLQSAYDLLKSNTNYSEFLDLINMSAQLSLNQTATQAQKGYQSGVTVDTIFDVTYPSLAFNIMNEKTVAPVGYANNASVRYQNGIIAPTNQALEKFYSDFLIGSGKYGTIRNAPDFFRRIIANTYMSKYPIYPSILATKGYYNGENDYITFDANSIIEKKMGSNCTFIGVNQPIIPYVFRSVAGPVYEFQNYSETMYSIELAGILADLKKQNVKYSFFVENDFNCHHDSTLYNQYNDITKIRRYFAYNTSIKGPITTQGKTYILGSSDVRTLLYNHIGTSVPQFRAQKEFIRNLAGNYIIIDQTISPWAAYSNNQSGYQLNVYYDHGLTVKGINGTSDTLITPQRISPDFVTNGVTYDIQSWMNFNSIANIYSVISSEQNLTKFYSLLDKAKLVDKITGKFTFMLDNDFYTVFAPTNAALGTAYDNLPVDQLKNFLLMYFVHGDIIFTDGNKPSGYYETMRKDEKSTDYSTVYTKLYVGNDEPDKIKFYDKSGNVIYTVNYNDSKVNIITGLNDNNASTNTRPWKVTFSTGVIHEINTVLVFGQTDTN
jgi:Secreted and surface protein containing fasciclin-like repeats